MILPARPTPPPQAALIGSIHAAHMESDAEWEEQDLDAVALTKMLDENPGVFGRIVDADLDESAGSTETPSEPR